MATPKTPEEWLKKYGSTKSETVSVTTPGGKQITVNKPKQTATSSAQPKQASTPTSSSTPATSGTKSAAVNSATKTRSRDSGVRQAYAARLGTEENTRAAKAEMDSAFSDYQSAIVRYEEAKKKYNPTTFADQPRNTSTGLEDSYREFFTAQEDVNRLKKQYEDKRTNYQRNLDAASERYLDQYSRPTTYTSDNLEDYFDRINQLASLDTWTDKQRKEAEEIYDIMRGGQFSSNLYQITKSDRFKPNYSAIAAEKSASGEWTPEQYLNYIELESRLGNKVHAKTAAAMTGFLQGIGATSLVDTVASLSGNEALKDSSGIMKETAAFGQKAAPGFYAAGSMAGNIALLSSLSNVAGQAIGGAMKGTSIAIKAAGTTLNITPQIIGAASNVVAFTAADAIQNAGTLASGEMSGAEYALSLGRAALGSTAGSLAQGLASTGISVILKNRGLMTPLGEFARLTVSSIAHSGAYIGTDYALRKEKPSKEELATRFATAFAFSILNGAVSTYQNTKIATRNFENGLKQVQELYARMEQGAANMTPAERADLAKTIAGMTQEIRNGINSSYLAGQQENVNKLNGALDIIESSARQYADGFASARAATQYSGNILGETSAVTDTDIQDVLIDAVEGGLEPIQQGENGLTIQQAPETVANAPIETSAPLATAAANGIVLPTAQQETPITLPGNTAGEITPAEDIEDNRIDLMTAEELENIRNAASETETAESAIANPAEITQEITQENIPARADLPETVQTRTPNEEILWTAPKDNGGWKTQYNGDIPIYDALQITDRDLFNAFRAEGSGEGVRSTPIINAYIATWEDVRQGTISPMAAAQLLSAVYRSGGVESLTSIYNPATGNLRPEALEAAKQLDIRHAEERPIETGIVLPRAGETSISEQRAELDRAYQNGIISAEDYANTVSKFDEIEGGISNGESNITAGEPQNEGEVSLPDRYAGRRGPIPGRGRIERVSQEFRIRGGTREHSEIVAQRLGAVVDQPYTSTESLGVPYGTETESVRILPESEYDEETRAAIEWAVEKGVRDVVVLVGDVEVGNEYGRTTIQGVVNKQTRTLFVRADSQSRSLSENIEHEVGHWISRIANVQAFIKSVTEQYSYNAWNPVYESYKRVYERVTNNYAGMTDEEIELYVWEEVMADAYSETNRYGVRAGVYGPEADAALENAETTPAAYPETQNTEIAGPEETANTRGPPERIDLMTAEEMERARYSLNHNFRSEFDEWMKNNTLEQRLVDGGRFFVGTTSEKLRAAGVDDYDIYWGKSKIAKIMQNAEMTDNVILQVPNVIENPIIVMDSLTVDGSIVMFGDARTQSGKPVMVSMLLHPETKTGEVLDYGVVTSAYGRRINNAKSLIERSNIRWVDTDKKRTSAWSKALGLQLPSASTTADSKISITDNAEKSNSKFSANDEDSDGRALTKAQQEYFKDSKVRDEEGRLLVMYHGTPNAGFTEFRSGSYFTQHREWADVYQNPSASSISAGKQATNPGTYAVYLNITKPFDTRNATEREIFYNEYYRQWGMGTDLQESGLPDWMDGMDLQEFIEENGYDYDGLILDEGGVGGYGEDVVSRGLSYVTFSEEQVKNIDNENPTQNPDIRFSLEEPVEETEDLIALHNLSAEKLSKALKLGGFPMPSIAVTKASIPHTNFGDITLVMDKSTVDPQYSRKNTVYSADAWTPTFPQIEYEVNEKVADRLRTKYYELYRKFGNDATRPLYPWGNYAEDELNRAGGEAQIIERAQNDVDMMKLYLMDEGFDVPETVTEEKIDRLDDGTIRFYDHFINALGEDAFQELTAQPGQGIMQMRKDWWAKYGEAFENAYREYMADLGFSEEEMDNVLDNETVAAQTRKALEMRNYIRNGPEKRTVTTNTEATNNAIRAAVNEDAYTEWLHDLFDGIQKNEGIYNNRDRYTSSGDRRSFRTTHYDVTLDNIAKAMASQNEGNSRNVDGFYGVKSLRAGMAERFDSIERMHELEGRLQHLTEEEAEEINNALSARLSDIMQRIYETRSHSSYENQFIEIDRIGDMLMEATETRPVTDNAIVNAFKNSGYLITYDLAEDVKELLFDVAQMPVNIFEAKPERAVRFDEVRAAIVPQGTDAELIQGLHDAGVENVMEYEKDNDADRLEKVNSVENVRFSVDDEEDPLETALEMLDNGAPPSDVYHETGLVVMGNGNILNGIGGEVIGRYDNGRSNAGGIRGVREGIRSGEVYGGGNGAGLAENPQETLRAKGGDWRNLSANSRERITEATENHMAQATDDGKELYEAYASPEEFAERFYSMLQQGRVVAEQWRNYVPDIQGLMDEINDIVSTPDQNNPNVRFSAEDEEEKPARRTRKPVAESRPIIAKRDLKTNMLNLFSIPDGMRGQMGEVIDQYADRLLKNGSLTQQDYDAFFDRMYAEGVMMQPAIDEFREARDMLTKSRIYVTEAQKHEFGDDWNDFRKRAFAAGIYLTNDASERGPDAWNAELSQTLPGMFSADELDDRRILEQIVQIAEEGKDEKMSLAEYTALISAEGGVSEDEILDNMERQMDWALRTFAEKAKLEIKLRDRTGVKIAQERERAGQSAVRQRDRETASREKERERRKDMAQRTKENRELRELQQRTLKQLQWLSRNSYRAPNDLKAAWDEVLGDIDIYAVGAANEMNYSKKYGATWRDLVDMYNSAHDSDPNFLPSKEMKRIKERLEGSHIGDMDIGTLQDLYKMAVGLRTEFYNRNNVINDEQRRMFAEVYEDSKKEINEADGGYTGRRLDRFFNTEQMTPINVLERMGGWDPDGAFFSMAKQLEKGERDMRAFKVKAEAQLKDFIDEHQEWLKTADGQGRNAKWYELEVPELLELGMGDKPIFGKSVKVYMTPVQKVHMYLESRNYDNLRHMVGGRTFANKELYSKGKRNEAFAQGTTVKLAPETVKKIVSDLTEEEMALANALDRYYNGFATENINKVSNALYGFDKAMGRNYAPIFTNENYVTSELGVFDQTAEGVGNLKARVYSKNPSYNISALDAFEKNVEQTSRFVGMAIPARNWQKLLNWQEPGNSMDDVLTHKWGKEGKKYIEDLITTLQGGGSRQGKGTLEGWPDTLLSHYVSAVFGANPGIVFKQAASFPQFASALGWINAPAPHQMIRVNEDLINTYSSELAYRKLGYATPETAQLKNNPTALQSNKTLRFLFGGGAIISMDAGTVKRGWVWAENKVRRENPELEIGTQEQIAAGESPFYKKVAEEFENAVSLTQPMYDEMHRANIMKDGKGVVRAFTMFKTVPLQQYNSMRRAFGEMNSAKRQRKNAGEGAREQANEKYRRAANKAAGTVTATIASVIMLEAVELLNNLLKNKAKRYRDDEGELTVESASEEFLTRSAQDLAGMVIVGKELSEVLANWFMGEKWYGIDVPGGKQLNDFIESVSDAKSMIEKIITEGSNILANGGDIEEYLRRNSADYAGAAKEIAEKLSMYLGGFPAENIEKYIMGSMQHISPELYTAMQDVFKNPTKSSLADLMGEALTTRVTNLLNNRNVEISEEAAAEIAALYEAGYKTAIPSETPKKISVNDEDQYLNAYQQQTFNTVWSGTVSGALEDLIESDEYRAADEETRAKMIDRLYDYATQKARQTVFDDYEIEGAADRADYALAYGVDPALYMAAATITGGMSKQREKIDALINLDASEFDKKILYNAIIGSKQENGDYVAAKDEAIGAFWDADLSFEQFLEAQYQYQTIKEQDSDNKATEFSRWVNSQNYNDEQAKAVRDNFKYFSMFPEDAGSYDKLYSAGLDDETAYAASSALSELVPEDGKTQVSDLQKMRAIVDSVSDTDEQMTAISAVVKDTAFIELSIAHDYDIDPEIYVHAQEALPDYDADGSGKYKQAEVRAMIDGITGGDIGGIVLPGGEYIYLSNDQKAVLWQLLNKSTKSAKNNPYSRSVGQQVLDAKARAKEETQEAETEEISSIALPEIVLPRG